MSNIDSSKDLPIAAFDKMIDTSIVRLRSKRLSEISDGDHINIMLCLNTVTFDKRFAKGKYATFISLAREKHYYRDIIKLYPKWTPNRGMGFYFPKLRMELAGSPRLYAKFNIIDSLTK